MQHLPKRNATVAERYEFWNNGVVFGALRSFGKRRRRVDRLSSNRSYLRVTLTGMLE